MSEVQDLSFKVNPTTLLFEGLNPAEKREIRQVVEALVLKGEIPNPHPPWLTEWFRVAKIPESKQLLALSTSFPQRALLSLL